MGQGFKKYIDTNVFLALIVHMNDLVTASCTSRVEMIVEIKAPPKLREHNERGAISNTILEAYALCVCTIHTTSMGYWIHMSSYIYLNLYWKIRNDDSRFTFPMKTNTMDYL